MYKTNRKAKTIVPSAQEEDEATVGQVKVNKRKGAVPKKPRSETNTEVHEHQWDSFWPIYKGKYALIIGPEGAAAEVTAEGFDDKSKYWLKVAIYK